MIDLETLSTAYNAQALYLIEACKAANINL